MEKKHKIKATCWNSDYIEPDTIELSLNWDADLWAWAEHFKLILQFAGFTKEQANDVICTDPENCPYKEEIIDPENPFVEETCTKEDCKDCYNDECLERRYEWEKA